MERIFKNYKTVFHVFLLGSIFLFSPYFTHNLLCTSIDCTGDIMWMAISCFLLLIIGFIFRTTVVSSSNLAIQTFFSQIFPSLFFFMFLCDCLAGIPFTKKFSAILAKIFRRVFRYHHSTSYFFLFITPLIGNPGLAKLVNDSISSQELSFEEGNEVVSHHSSFTLSYLLLVTSTLFPPIQAIQMILSMLLGRILLILFLQIRKPVPKIFTISNEQPYSFNQIMFQSVDKNLSICFGILGMMMIAGSIRGILLPITPSFVFPFLEATSGLLYGSTISPIIAILALCFGGFTIHLQIKKVFPGLRYTYFVYCRILHGLISVVIFSLITHFF